MGEFQCDDSYRFQLFL